MKTDYDAIIVGAGPAGSTAAILLALAGWSVALVEKQRFPRRKVCGECIAASNFPLLEMLGIGGAFAQSAGPELHEFALYCNERVARAPVPALGRALGRQTFDMLLLERARAVGAAIWQPWTLRAVRGSAGEFQCVLEERTAITQVTLRAPILVMANGSWEGDPTAESRGIQRASDLFAFKANFSHARLTPGVLPVLSFAGGYGGLVVADQGQLTLAGCVRRDVLRACRAAAPGQTAGEAFEMHLRARLSGVRNALEGARREGPWLGIGPVRPGIREFWRQADGAFMIGNAAAEAHPIIGEGISMAMQSAWLLSTRLIAAGHNASADTLRSVGAAYTQQWHREFGPRLRLAAVLAQMAMRPGLAPLVWPLISRTPHVMSTLVRRAGKTRIAVPLERFS